MRVEPVGMTRINWNRVFEVDEEPWAKFMIDSDDHLKDTDVLAEAAGRNCYQSWDKPNPATATNGKYLAKTVGKDLHESILEHSSVTFYVDGVSRALLLELERHRFLSFSVVSQRYVDESEGRYVVPPLVENDELLKDALKALHGELTSYYALIVAGLTIGGTKRKQAREAARAVLPQMQETKMFVTGNIRAWRDVIKKRHHVAADAEIQQFANLVLGHLRAIAPNSVQDISDAPFS